MNIFSVVAKRKAGAWRASSKAAMPSIIGAELTIIGDLISDGDILIDGTVEGYLKTSGLTIGERGTIKGVATAEAVTIAGTLNGQIHARDVTLSETARIQGHIWQDSRIGSQSRFPAFAGRRQMVVAALLLGVVVLSIYASLVYFSYDARVAARADYERAMAGRDVAVTEGRDPYRDLRSALLHPFATLADTQLETQHELAALRERNAKLGPEMARLENELAHSRAERDRLLSEEEALTRRRDGLESELADMHRRNEATTAQLANFEQSLASLTTERDKVAQERAALASHVGDLEHHLDSLQADQKMLISRLKERAISNAIAVERTIAMTGLDVNKLLGQAGKEGAEPRSSETAQGGPFVAYRIPKNSSGKPTARSSDIERVVLSLDKQEERQEGLHRILDRLPLASPLDGYRVVSNFGRRIDPINGQLAMHEGVDLTAEPNAPVRATAPGIVIFAGWDGGYGKMVEIDHGMGIHTRYAHLSSIVVEPGSKVAAREKIGVIGSTGRSTGTHVHYEILVDDQHYDPVKFIKAGEYVYQED